MTKEYCQIVDPSFLCAVYEMEKKIKEGWSVCQEQYKEPIYIGGVYDINLVKGGDVAEIVDVCSEDEMFEMIGQENNVLEQNTSEKEPTPLPTKEKVFFKAPKQTRAKK